MGFYEQIKYKSQANPQFGASVREAIDQTGFSFLYQMDEYRFFTNAIAEVWLNEGQMTITKLDQHQFNSWTYILDRGGRWW